MIPRDVRTRWNSTYDMIVVAIQYKDAVNRVCSEKENGLRDLELDEEEWDVARQLRDALEVRVPFGQTWEPVTLTTNFI